MRNTIQFYIAYILSKIILCLTLLCCNTNNYISRGEYNFITLFGPVVFVTALIFELKNRNYILVLISIAGLILFQPLLPIIGEWGYGSIQINQNLFVVIIIILSLWVIYDGQILRTIIKKQNFKLKDLL